MNPKLTEQTINLVNGQVCKIEIIDCPTESDWLKVKQRALVTCGKTMVNPPTSEWKRKILLARHSPIRKLNFSFYLSDIPYWLSTELCRHHEGCEKYVKSQRNDRQESYDRNEAYQNAPVNMIWDFNAESLMTIASKRLCGKATKEAQQVMGTMAALAEMSCPEFKGMFRTPCGWTGKCYEMETCGRTEEIK